MLLGGSAFDTDPQYWPVANLLKSGGTYDQMFRASKLHEKVVDYIDKVVGPSDQFTVEALRGIAFFARRPAPLFSDNLLRDLLGEIERIYPQKFRYVGAEACAALIKEGIDAAHAHGLDPVRGPTLMCVLMLAFGHGCLDDPLYPWIGRTLRDERIIGGAERGARLEKKALTWLHHVLASFEGPGRA
jgi:hypothetical protein